MASKKRRKQLKALYNKPERVIDSKSDSNNSEQKIKGEEGKNWIDIRTMDEKKIPNSSDVFTEVRALMLTRTKEFIIYLKKGIEPQFMGAIAQAVKAEQKFEVRAVIDEILFLVNKKGSIEIAYVRIYSDFPPSVREFTLEEIEKIEELVEKPALVS